MSRLFDNSSSKRCFLPKTFVRQTLINIGIFFWILAWPATNQAQKQIVLYQMQQVPQSNLLNPAHIPLANGFLGFPGLSGIRLNGAMTGLNYATLDLSLMGPSNSHDYGILRESLKSGINSIFSEIEIDLLHFGFRTGKGFLSFHVGDRVFSNMVYSPDILSLFEDVQTGRFLQNPTDVTYDQSRHQFQGSYYRSYSLGYAHPITDRLTLGGRFRFLQGIAGIWSENQDLSFRYPGDGNYFQISGQANTLSGGLNVINGNNHSFPYFPSGNFGFAVDIGATYQFNDQLDFSFSALNIGQIAWKKDVNYQVIGEHLNFSAIDLDDHLDLWGGLFSNLTDERPANEEVRFTTPLPTSFYLGGNYYFRPNSSVGLLVNAMRFASSTDVAIAVSGATRLGKTLGFSLALTHNRYQVLSLGTGFSLDFLGLQIYAATDNLPAVFNWQDAHQLQGVVGLNLVFGKKLRSEKLSSDQFPPIAAIDTLSGTKVPENTPDSETSPSDAVRSETLTRQEMTTNPETATETSLEPNPKSELTQTTIASEAPTAVSPNFILQGPVIDATTSEILEGIKVEVHVFNEQGEKELQQLQSFYNGTVSIVLERRKRYEVIINRQNYTPYLLELGPDQIGNAPTMERAFLLRTAEISPAAADSTIQEEPQLTQTETELIPATSPQLSGDRPVADDKPLTTALPTTDHSDNQDKGIYVITASTSLREGPIHTSNVLLRLQTGDEVEVLKKTSQWWWKVRFQEDNGYVKAQLLNPK